MSERKSVFLHGAGLDSTAYLACLIEDATPIDTVVHVDYGHVAASLEEKTIRKQLKRLSTNGVSIPFVSVKDSLIKHLNDNAGLLFTGEGSPTLAARNLVLMLNAIPYGDIVHIGLCVEPLRAAFEDAVIWPEKTEQFLNMNFPGRQIEVKNPKIAKKDLMERGYRLNPYLFEDSMSCWVPVQGKPCGKCSHCIQFSFIQKEITCE